MRFAGRVCRTVVGACAVLSCFSSPAWAYIGPGAGFAFLGSFLVFLATFLLALFSLVSWPVRLVIKALLGRRKTGKKKVSRVVVLGLDGMDPGLAERMMSEGKLPNLARLAVEGTFARLGTTCPALSPVAWSSFVTGTNPGRHNIFDFLSRDPRSYLPDLSSARIKPPSRSLTLGPYRIPLGRPTIRLLRKSKPFWHALGESGVFSSILRVPITFPPEKFRGVLFSGMCIPDLRGTQGSFTYFTTDEEELGQRTGGVCLPLKAQGRRFVGELPGPDGSMREGKTMSVRLSLVRLGQDEMELRVGRAKLLLRRGEYSPWVQLTFKPGLWFRVRGTCRFLLLDAEAHPRLYVTPINIDPSRPALPISHPFIYAVYLSKLIGSYVTLGLADDTWALNEGILDDRSFLDQCYLNHADWERMFFRALEKSRDGLCVMVFETTDSVQHMCWRYMEPDHPAPTEDLGPSVVEELYTRMDDLVGRVLEKLDDKACLLVISDHGFSCFRRGVNLNTWLQHNGYLALKNGGEGREWFGDVDWSRTKAYAFGLGGLYLNLRGREGEGTIQRGAEAERLKVELIGKLTGLVDEEEGNVAIREVFDTSVLYEGPYVDEAPDLVVGYERGYRTSWDSAVGKVSRSVFENNTRRWSGDHCVHPELVPGVVFSNLKLADDSPRLMDLGPTILDLFGVAIPGYMDGKSLLPKRHSANV
jgi:predicted AlkP superfamily phosphohydrolase/phosphomutase